MRLPLAHAGLPQLGAAGAGVAAQPQIWRVQPSLLRMSDADASMSEADLEKARTSLQRLVEAPPTAGIDGFDFETKRAAPPTTRGFEFEARQAAPPPPVVEDDIAAGLDEAKAIGSSISGNFMLLVEICVGGLTSPIGLAMIALFGVLVATGAAGDSPDRFVAQAPSASEGRYYERYDTPALELDGGVSSDEASFFGYNAMR